MQEGCEYLIARTAEGKLDLRDIYVHDKDLDIFARPEVHGELPEQPLYYQEVPWTVMYTGDRINNKMPWKRVSMSPSTLDIMPVLKMQQKHNACGTQHHDWEAGTDHCQRVHQALASPASVWETQRDWLPICPSLRHHES